MHAASRERSDQSAFEELRSEFQEHFKDLRTVVVKQGSTSHVKHVHVLGLPLLGKTHASVGNGIIHVASVLGLRLPWADDPDGKQPPALVPGGMELQAYRCCQIAEQVLRSCSAGWGDLLRLTVHVPDLTSTKLECIEQVIDAFFEEKQCPSITRTAVGCSRLRMSAAVQLEGLAMAANSESLPPPPPGLERPVPLPGQLGLGAEVNRVDQALRDLQRQWTVNTFDEVAADDSTPSAAVQAGKGTWLVVEALQERPEAAPKREIVAAPLAAPPASTDENTDRVAEPAKSEFALLGFVGQLSSLHLGELSRQEVLRRRFQFQKHHDSFCQVEMLMNKAYRTVRLDPGVVACRRLSQEARHAVRAAQPGAWSYTFDVAVARTANSFINIGLVEWIAAAAPLGREDSGREESEPSLAQLAGASWDDSLDSWQHTSENPRQIMLGCRKGVKWYGNSSWENLFKDDICEDTVLRFQCDFYTGPRGGIKQMRLWLLPSAVVFRKRGQQCVRLAKPLMEWVLPTAGPKLSQQACSLWVPAVTLFCQEDVVVMAWRKSAELGA